MLIATVWLVILGGVWALAYAEGQRATYPE